MDKTTRLLAEYVTGLSFSDLSAETVREAKKRLIDTVACAFGGFRSEPAQIARRVAESMSARPTARILGTGTMTSPEMAAFAGASMVRYLDFNDSYISTGAGHPSDMTPGILAIAEAYGSSGEKTLTAIVAAYEVFSALADLVPLRERGWDQGVFVVLGAAAGAGKLLGLSVEQMADALSIAVSSNVPTRQTRAGELSMWKGVATAASARAGVFAAMLARAGMNGPTAAFEGKHGVWEQVTGPFEITQLGGKGVPFGIERTHLKFFPSEFHSQVPLSMALTFRHKVPLAAIESIAVEIYYMAYSEIGSEPEKWEPKTRETADHSLPFLLATALVDGRITPESFRDERLVDPEMRALMRRISVAENAEFTRQFPAIMHSRMELTIGGQHLVEEGEYPRGHIKNPMNDDEVEAKFRDLAEGVLRPEQGSPLIEALWHFEEAKSIAPVLDLIVIDE